MWTRGRWAVSVGMGASVIGATVIWIVSRTGWRNAYREPLLALLAAVVLIVALWKALQDTFRR